jgi:hypothetical protein
MGSPAAASATSKPPIASIPIPPPAGVWLSEPRVFCRVCQNVPCTTWLIPFPGLLNQNQNVPPPTVKDVIHILIIRLEQVMIDIERLFPVWLFLVQKLLIPA